MVKKEGLLKKLSSLCIAGSLILSPASPRLFAQQQKKLKKSEEGITERANKNFRKSIDYIFENDENYNPKYRYHNIRSIMDDEYLNYDDIDKRRDPYTIGIFDLFDNYAFLDTLDERDNAGVLIKYSADNGKVKSKKILTSDEAKELITGYSKDKRLIGRKFDDFQKNCSQLNEFKPIKIKTLRDDKKIIIEFFDTKVAYKTRHGIITDVIELEEDVYKRANRSENEILLGNSEKSNFLRYRSINGGTIEGTRLKIDLDSDKKRKGYKTLFSKTEKDKSKYAFGLSIFNIKDDIQYGEIGEWDAFIRYSPELLYFLENSEFSFMTGATSTKKEFEPVNSGSYTLEQILKTKSDPLLNFQALLNFRKQISKNGEKPFVRIGAANVSGEDQYEWKWLNADGSLNSEGSTLIPSRYSTISGDLGIQRENFKLAYGKSFNTLEQEEKGKMKEYSHSINNAELMAGFDWINFETIFDLIYQAHSNKGLEGKNKNLSSNIQLSLHGRKSGFFANFMKDEYTGNNELEGKLILSPYANESIKELSDIKRKQSLYGIRNNNNYLPSLSPFVSYIPLIIPRGFELTASVGEKYGERFHKGTLGFYVYKNFGADIGYESTKKDSKTTFAIKKSF